MSSGLLVAGRSCENCGAVAGSTGPQCPDCGAPTPARSAALDGTDPAPVRRRTVAVLIDALPAVVVLAAVVFARVTSADGWWWPTLLGLAAAWLMLLLGWGSANGQGPGSALAGVRVVDGRTGKGIGVRRTIVRQLTRIAALVGTLGIAGLSYRWDPAGRERTWWDRTAGSRVIAAGDGEDPGARFVDPAAENRWTPKPPIDRVPGRPDREDRSPDGAAAGSPTGRSSDAALPAARSTQRSAPPSAPLSAPPSAPLSTPRPAPRPTPEPPPFRVPPAVRPSMVQRPPSAVDPESTRVVRRTEIAGDPTGPDATDVILRKEITGGAASPAAAPAAGPDVTGMVARADIAAITGSTSGTPGSTGSEATHVVPRSAIGAGRPATATLAWDSGSRVVAGGVVIIGRDPVPGDGEHVDRRLAVGVESVGVSKTHLTLTITAGGVTVTDRFSTNGVRIERADGTALVCEPGRPTPAGRGDRILFGGRSIVIAQD